MHAGPLFLSLRGTPIDNDSFVDVDDIGNSDSPLDNRLLCLTNETDCCGNADGSPSGGWNFPDGSVVGGVPSGGTVVDVFTRNRGTSVVRLLRHGNPSERGRFRCDIRGAFIYTNICK